VEVVDEYLHSAPAVPLRSYIPWYSGYRQRGVAPMRHRGLPSPWLALIFTLEEPMTAAALPGGHPGGSYDSYVGGLHRTPALIVHDGAQSGVQVALSPLGCRRLLGLPGGELAGENLTMDELLGSSGRRVRERLLAAATWGERFAVLDRFFTDRLNDRRPGPPDEVSRAWTLLLESHGGVGVAELAAEVGWSARNLAYRFSSEIGLSPKAAAQVTRFDFARRLLMQRRTGLARLSADCGYADQAHLSREFSEMAGLSPRRWLAEESGNLPNPSRPADAAAGTVDS
jgi:AraC-like DNA-binding protein